MNVLMVSVSSTLNSCLQTRDAVRARKMACPPPLQMRKLQPWEVVFFLKLTDS